jgi:hypothetical protein
MTPSRARAGMTKGTAFCSCCVARRHHGEGRHRLGDREGPVAELLGTPNLLKPCSSTATPAPRLRDVNHAVDLLRRGFRQYDRTSGTQRVTEADEMVQKMRIAGPLLCSRGSTCSARSGLASTSPCTSAPTENLARLRPAFPDVICPRPCAWRSRHQGEDDNARGSARANQLREITGTQ